ncbi:hypothetical protein AB0J47_27575 [Nocardia sp. NPDC049737]|uniref:hypothetical protein n=1 Tax=Nocardia sp. NPDC049737 TaxID=3154358 RepID=UPI00344AEEFA
MTAVENAFRWARIQAVRHMAACDQTGLRWSETTITELVTAHTSRAVTVVPFTQRAEALSGADWVWWWVDGADAYGMLVQAKRVTVARSRWNFDFGYRARGAARSQRELPRSTAAALGLLPVYALYLGTGDYRRWERCSDVHRSGRCLHCVKRAVSLMPALLADELFVSDAASTYGWSVALEDLWTRPTASAPLIPALKKQLVPELSDFLQNRQDGTRAVARSMIDRVLSARSGQFSAVSTSVASEHYGNHDQLGPVFGDVPDDTGHWGLRYFEHTLNPLRHTPPGYVLEITTGDFNEDRLASNMPGNVAGIVVVRVPQHE